MNITNTVLTKTAEETTSNATYIIEYVLINEVLTRIHATVQAFQPDGIEKLDVGYITYENGNIFCNLNPPSIFSILRNSLRKSKRVPEKCSSRKTFPTDSHYSF